MTDSKMTPTINEFADHYLACDHCGEAKVREGDGETICEECKAIIEEDGE